MKRSAGRWRGRRRVGGRRPDDRGSLSVELALLAVPLLAMVDLFFSFGRYTQVGSAADSAARDGARAASMARTLNSANQRVADIRAELTDDSHGLCAVPPGQPGFELTGPFEAGTTITVTMTCQVHLGDLGFLHFPSPDMSVARTFSIVLDEYRSTR